MTPEKENPIQQDEISHLAYLNWQKDGCPSGCDLNYWLEAESHLKATKHLHLGENEKPAQKNGETKPQKSRVKSARKSPARRELSPQF